jgi:hypothetical protein
MKHRKPCMHVFVSLRILLTTTPSIGTKNICYIYCFDRINFLTHIPSNSTQLGLKYSSFRVNSGVLTRFYDKFPI